MRLKRLITRQAKAPRDVQSLQESSCRVIRRPDGLNFPLADQVGKGSQSLFERSPLVILMSLIKVNPVNLEASKRIFDGSNDVVTGQPSLPISHIHSNFSSNDDLIAPARLFDPPAENRLGFAALVLRCPPR